jgi:transcriptional regulator with XRE-family HTH domain
MLELNILMKKRNVTQTALARFLGVKQGTVSNWKTGRTPMPSCYVNDVCYYLHTTPNALFGFKEVI